MSYTAWLVVAYAVGTFFGYFLGVRIGFMRAAQVASSQTIDILVESGYLKATRDSKGQVNELVPIKQIQQESVND